MSIKPQSILIVVSVAVFLITLLLVLLLHLNPPPSTKLGVGEFILESSQVLLAIVGTIAILLTLEQTQAATKATLKAAEIAEKALDRPYILLKIFNTQFQPGDHWQFSCEFQIKNFGKSPAIIRKIRIVHILSSQIPASVPDDPISSRIDYPVLEQSSDYILNYSFIHPYTAEAYNHYVSGKLKLYLCGDVDYIDVYSVTRRRSFCFTYDRPRNMINEAGGRDWNNEKEI